MQNEISELIGIDNPTDFVETTLDDYEDEFIMLDTEENTSTVRDKYRKDPVIVFTSAYNNILRASLVQYRY